MKRFSTWNLVFHRAEVRANLDAAALAHTLSGMAGKYVAMVKSAHSLHELLDMHKEIWGLGYRNDGLGPNFFGMFRCYDIAKMKPEEVYLGKIYGLWDFDITFWEKRRGELIGPNDFGLNQTIPVYSLVLEQYRRRLVINIRKIAEASQELILDARKLGYPV